MLDASWAKDRSGRQKRQACRQRASCLARASTQPKAQGSAFGPMTSQPRGQEPDDKGGFRCRGVTGRMDCVTTAPLHGPVLARELSQWLDPRPGEIIADGTLGGG